MTASSIPPDIPFYRAINPCSFFAVLEFAKTQGTKQGTIAALLSLEIFMKTHSNTKTIQYDNTKYCTCIPVFRGIERQHPESRTDRTIPGKHLARYLLPFVSLSGQGTRKSSQESPCTHCSGKPLSTTAIRTGSKGAGQNRGNARKG